MGSTKTGSIVAGGCIALIALVFIRALVAGWVLMLLVGASFHIFEWPSTTIGFWPAVGLAFLISLVWGLLTGANRVNSTRS